MFYFSCSVCDCHITLIITDTYVDVKTQAEPMINKQVEKCDEDLNHIVTDALIDKAHDRGCLRPEKLESNAEWLVLKELSRKDFQKWFRSHIYMQRFSFKITTHSETVSMLRQQ